MEEKAGIDILWVLVSAVLVAMMQGGFLCLESGVTRSKNAINVAMKNIADFVVAIFAFWLVGFGLMFGLTTHGVIGTNHFLAPVGQGHAWLSTFFIFQVMFCATAATIVSGAVSERIRFNAYIIITFVVVSLIYPVSGHWAWNGAITDGQGWLAERGFVDFAGSTVVHSVGGWVSLAALFLIGPRQGRFANGKVMTLPASNLPLAMLGLLLFIIGWVGFNGGSTLALNAAVPGIIANTILAAAAGGIAAYLICLLYPQVCTDPGLVSINGILAGLVSITASCHAVTAGDAILIGGIGAAVMLVIDQWMIQRQIDDAIAAVPVHLGAGVWGTLAVGLFGNPDLLGTGLDWFGQIKVQLLGIVVIGLWAFVVSYLVLAIINRLSPLRVSQAEEEIGLNVSEHGAKTELLDLLNAMEAHATTQDLKQRAPVEPFSEVGQIASLYNRVVDSLERAIIQTKSIVRDLRDGVVTFSAEGILTSFNPGAEKLFGMRASQALGHSVGILIHASDDSYSKLSQPNGGRVVIDELLLGRKKEIIGQRADRSPFYMELTVSKGVGRYGDQYTGLIRDVTDRRRVEEQLYQEKEQAQVTLESIVDGVITTDAGGRVKYLNHAAEHLLGWQDEEARGLRLQEVYHLSDEVTGERIDNIAGHVLTEGKVISESATYQVTSKDGRVYAIHHTISPITNRQHDIIGAVLVFHDITHSREMQRQLSHQAMHDGLTGLMNRTAFESRVAEALQNAKLGLNSHILCYLDLDQFKLVNDTCGHIAGDELLRQIATLLSDHMRESDIVARLGGDEFGVLLYNCPIDKGVEIAEKIREAIRSFRFPWNERQFAIGVSIGMVAIAADTESLTQLLSLADAACYAAKDKGRNCVHVYAPNDMEIARTQEKMQWATRIQEALDADRFRLYYQTIAPIDDVTENSGHYEIFIRMLDDKDNIVPPGAFIPAAERYDLMTGIDRWVIKNTLAWIGDQAKHGKSMIRTCAINLSGPSVGNEKCLAFIKQCLQHYNVPAQVICFEITETAAIANIGSAGDFIRELKALGCRFALDDFGSGLSSFGYLKNLPVDYLKIDGAFIREIDGNTVDYAMVESINAIGHVMGLQTIAEFVETESILDTLRNIGVDFVQGYHINRPRPLEQMEGVAFMPR